MRVKGQWQLRPATGKANANCHACPKARTAGPGLASWARCERRDMATTSCANTGEPTSGAESAGGCQAKRARPSDLAGPSARQSGCCAFTSVKGRLQSSSAANPGLSPQRNEAEAHFEKRPRLTVSSNQAGRLISTCGLTPILLQEGAVDGLGDCRAVRGV